MAIDKTGWPERILWADAPKFFGLNLNLISKRIANNTFAPRYKGAMGFYFLASEVTEFHIAKRKNTEICDCGVPMKCIGTQTTRKYYRCLTCDARRSVRADTGEPVARRVKAKPEPKPKVEKIEVAKSTHGKIKEAQEVAQRKNMAGLFTPAADMDAVERRKKMREQQYQQELRRIDREFNLGGF